MSKETASGITSRIAGLTDAIQFYSCGGTGCTSADACGPADGASPACADDSASTPQVKIDAATAAVRAVGNSLSTCATSTGAWTGGAFNTEYRFFKPYALSDVAGTANNGAGVEWIHNFVRQAMRDLSGTDSNPVTGEGRNSLGMDKYKGRGNQYNSGGGGFGGQHYFEHQSDLPSQENRDFFDRRVKDQ